MISVQTIHFSPRSTTELTCFPYLRLILALLNALGSLLGVSILAPAAHAAVEYQILKSFGATPSDGVYPSCSLVEGSDGALYGTTVALRHRATAADGVSLGTVFKLNKDGSGYAVLHNFDSSVGNPEGGAAGLVDGSNGALYGVTWAGGGIDGPTGIGGGTVFTIDKDGSGYEVLYAFDASIGDGTSPLDSLIQGSDGALYGTTFQGGAYHPCCGGTVFKINPDGSGYTLLYSLNYLESGGGTGPSGSLEEGSDGALYGTTSVGVGTVFKLNRDGSGYSILHNFTNSMDSGAPTGGVVEGSDGALYGPTGTRNGTVFKLNKDGSGYATLHSFGTNVIDGTFAQGRLVEGMDHALYGITRYGGSNNVGTVFKLNKDGSGYSVLHSFTTNSIDGQRPVAGLMQGSDGAFYGTTRFGGASNYGTVFRLSIPVARHNLAIVRTNSTITLTWPSNAIGFQLESATDLSANNAWSTVIDPIVVVGDQNTFNVDAVSGRKFYRLRKP